MQDFGFGFGTCLVLVIVLLILVSKVKEDSTNRSFDDITGKVTVYEKYDAGDLDSKKVALENCTKLLESNGYVAGYVESKDFGTGKRFLTVVGTRQVK